MASGHDVGLHLRGAYLAMHRRANAHFARFGVTADQFVLLTALARGDAVTQEELVRRCDSDANTVRAILVRLEGRGLLVRERHATDGRARSVALSPEGRRLQAELWEVNEAFQADLLTLFPPEDLRRLLAALRRIHDALTPAIPRGPRGRKKPS